jgi:hypothetical protein
VDIKRRFEWFNLSNKCLRTFLRSQKVEEKWEGKEKKNGLL